MTPAYLLAECQKSGVLVELAAGVLKLKGQPDAVQIAADKLRPFKGDLVRYLDRLAAEQFLNTGEFRQVSRTAAAVDNVIGIRLALFHDRGLNRAAAIALADRLTVRDQQHDERRVCLECAHMAGTANASGAYPRTSVLGQAQQTLLAHRRAVLPMEHRRPLH